MKKQRQDVSKCMAFPSSVDTLLLCFWCYFVCLSKFQVIRLAFTYLDTYIYLLLRCIRVFWRNITYNSIEVILYLLLLQYLLWICLYYTISWSARRSCDESPVSVTVLISMTFSLTSNPIVLYFWLFHFSVVHLLLENWYLALDFYLLFASISALEYHL